MSANLSDSSPILKVGSATYPFFGVQIKILGLPMLEKAGQADSIVCEMRLLSNDDYVIFPSL